MGEINRVSSCVLFRLRTFLSAYTFIIGAKESQNPDLIQSDGTLCVIAEGILATLSHYTSGRFDHCKFTF